jgi:beta-N-acetylhexosaminidase
VFDPRARLHRRRFLALLGSGAVTAILAACGVGRPSASPVSSPSPTPTPTPSPSTPSAIPSHSPTPTAAPDLRAQIAQMLLVGFRGTTAEEAASTIAEIRDLGLGGVLLFDFDTPTGSTVRNVVSPEQLSALVAALRGASSGPLIVAIDEEGGQVARLGPSHGFPPTQSEAELGAIGDPGQTQAAGRAIAETLAGVGVGLNLAPVVDLDINPANPIIGAIGRSYGADPALVSAQAEAFVAGHRAIGVRTAIKHFPGQGSAGADTHLGVVDVTDVWTDIELAPFRTLVADGMTDAVLTAHVFNANLDPEHPATLSKATVTGILRQQLGWDGVVISDDMQMGAIRDAYGYEEAVRLATDAGIDILTIANQQVYEEGIVARTIDLIEGFVRDGSISASRIAESAARIAAFKR